MSFLENLLREGTKAAAGHFQGKRLGEAEYRRPSRCWLRLREMCEPAERLDGGHPLIEIVKNETSRSDRRGVS